MTLRAMPGAQMNRILLAKFSVLLIERCSASLLNLTPSQILGKREGIAFSENPDRSTVSDSIDP